MKELSSEDEEEEEKDDDGELQGLLIKKKRRNKSMRERERERLLMMRSFRLTINATNKQNNIRSESSQLPSFSHQRRPLPFATTTNPRAQKELVQRLATDLFNHQKPS
jgi:hypothetical protein